MNYTRKTLQDLTIRDNFLFAAVMQQGDNCKHFLEMLLNIPLERIEIQYEKTVIFNPEYKGIRMDVYAKDENSTCYNIEMQVLWDELPKRSRYYHSQMDMELLGSGEDYENLPQSYVIFICNFDPFKKKRYLYSFENICIEDNQLKLQDGNRTIFLSTKGENNSDIPISLLNFLTFIRESQPGETKDYHDSYVAQLQSSIKQVKRNKELGSRFMLLELMLRDEYRKGKAEGLVEGRSEGRAEGLIEGRSEGRAEGLIEGRSEGKIEGKIEGLVEIIFDNIQGMGAVPDELRIFISGETDIDTLKSFLREASKASSISEFMENISFVSSK